MKRAAKAATTVATGIVAAVRIAATGGVTSAVARAAARVGVTVASSGGAVANSDRKVPAMGSSREPAAEHNRKPVASGAKDSNRANRARHVSRVRHAKDSRRVNRVRHVTDSRRARASPSVRVSRRVSRGHRASSGLRYRSRAMPRCLRSKPPNPAWPVPRRRARRRARCAKVRAGAAIVGVAAANGAIGRKTTARTVPTACPDHSRLPMCRERHKAKQPRIGMSVWSATKPRR